MSSLLTTYPKSSVSFLLQEERSDPEQRGCPLQIISEGAFKKHFSLELPVSKTNTVVLVQKKGYIYLGSYPEQENLEKDHCHTSKTLSTWQSTSHASMLLSCVSLICVSSGAGSI